MYSFKDINNNNIAFESVKDLVLSEQRDIISNSITAYLVEYGDDIYSISKKTYDTLESHGAIKK